MVNLPRRKLIILEDSNQKPTQKLLKILESPLGLAKILVCLAFSHDQQRNLLSFKSKLDSIKRMAAGLASAELKTDKIANYSIYLFAFQQFFHSSYRARQGNVLEEIIRSILTDINVYVYEKEEHSSVLKQQLGIKTETGHDVDVIASNNSESLLIQIRSRDDTGGTTAKGSLVELLRDVLREKVQVVKPIRYVIYVWEPLEENQKQSLITKILGEIKERVGTDDIRERLNYGKPVEVSRNIKLQLAYGPKQFADILVEFSENPKLSRVITETLEVSANWDDLWLTYAIASLELERLTLGHQSNFEILEQKLNNGNITFSAKDLKDYLNASAKYVVQIMPNWSEETLPVTSPADQLTYLRDLILLRMIYQKVCSECPSLTAQFEDVN
jgi:hypothetical protein